MRPVQSLCAMQCTVTQHVWGVAKFDFETEEVDLLDDNSQYSVEVDGCCEAHSK